MIQYAIRELVEYAVQNHLIEPEDSVLAVNRLLEFFHLNDYDYGIHEKKTEKRPLCEILEDLMLYARSVGMLEDDTVAQRDLLDTKIMGLLTPMPSVVRRTFWKKYEASPKDATDYFYRFSKATNYIRTDRITKDEKWATTTEYGPIDITINLSKPEKDPRDIARAGLAKPSSYPNCLLCKENEGYAGHIHHPARQNHRIIPITLNKETYYLQYSPYVYYNEHCIILNENHVPMKIDRDCFVKILDFVRQFPHYTAGSNADLPIVGGSILSHDHFQGGCYTFPMAKAPYEQEFVLPDFSQIRAGIVKWPMSVIRLQGDSVSLLADAADHILSVWRSYSDPAAFIFCETDGVPHNTITPIARMRDGLYELDLVLRNNMTTPENPWGIYHPKAEYHHIKKENIGLIEVMGLAILPARLKREMELLEEAVLNGKNLRENPELEKHADWAESWMSRYQITPGNLHQIVQNEISLVFVKVLECAGVYKRTPEGREAFLRFLTKL